MTRSDPQWNVPERVVTASIVGTKVVRGLSKTNALTLDALNIGSTICGNFEKGQASKKSVKNMMKVTTSIGSGWLGNSTMSWIGGVIGSFLGGSLPLAMAAVGGWMGTLIGGTVGSLAGSQILERIVDCVVPDEDSEDSNERQQTFSVKFTKSNDECVILVPSTRDL